MCFHRSKIRHTERNEPQYDWDGMLAYKCLATVAVQGSINALTGRETLFKGLKSYFSLHMVVSVYALGGLLVFIKLGLGERAANDLIYKH